MLLLVAKKIIRLKKYISFNTGINLLQAYSFILTE